MEAKKRTPPASTSFFFPPSPPPGADDYSSPLSFMEGDVVLSLLRGIDTRKQTQTRSQEPRSWEILGGKRVRLDLRARHYIPLRPLYNRRAFSEPLTASVEGRLSMLEIQSSYCAWLHCPGV